MSDWIDLTVGSLAVWRMSHLIAHEDGPWDVIVRLRAAAGSGTLGRLMDCPYCVSLWLAPAVAWMARASWRDRIVWWLALSGAACLIERWWESRRHAHDSNPASPEVVAHV